jgi:Domain of unknown function (DUF4331)
MISLFRIAACASLAGSLLATPLSSHASHHNDAATSKKDGRINITDMYVFPSKDGRSTVMVMNVGKDAGREGPKTLHPQAFYDFTVDVDGDLREDLRWRLRFKEPAADGSQAWSVERVIGDNAAKAEPVPLGDAARFGETVALRGGGRAWVGLAGDAFAANAAQYFKLIESAKAGKSDFSVFDKPANYFAEFDVISLVIEVPNSAFAKPDLNLWGAVWANNGGSAVQVNRWGNVLTAFLFAHGNDDAEAMNTSRPLDDVKLHRQRAAERIALFVKASDSAADPQAYAEAAARALVPIVMHYKVGTPAFYGIGASNGRALGDDAFDVIMSTVFNRTINDGVRPAGMRDEFPYVPASRRLQAWPGAR